MSQFGKVVLVGLLVLALGAGVRAAVDPSRETRPASDIELLVVEAEGCIYCRIFRRDVVPAYQTSERARSVPMRFADITEVEAGPLALAEPIDNVPTVLVLKAGREIGRVSGYVGPENFFHSLNRLLAGS